MNFFGIFGERFAGKLTACQKSLAEKTKKGVESSVKEFADRFT